VCNQPTKKYEKIKIKIKIKNRNEGDEEFKAHLLVGTLDIEKKLLDY
jgi:hypothetical protein